MRRQMWVRVGTMLAALVASSFAIVTGCLPDQERTTYGPAEALGPRPFPNPEPGNGSGGDAGGPDPGQICGGQGPVDAGLCNASWKDIFTTTISATGSLGCGKGGCHARNGTPPEISGDNAETAWNQLSAYTHKTGTANGKKYINPCTTAPGESAILCNLDGKNACGQMPPGGSAAAAELTKITEWVGCGSPNN